MKKKLFFLFIFVFFLIIFFLSPICGDDWGNYLEGIRGIRHSFGNAVGMYFDWEGRFVSRVLINILTSNKILWNILNSFIIVSIIYLIIKIINPKNKKIIYLLSFLTILLMNIYTFSQVIVWLAGNITYLFVIPLLLFYFYYTYNDLDNKKYKVVIFSFLNFIMTMFVEHMALVLITSNIIFIIYKYIKDKKIYIKNIIYLISSIIGFSLMFLSPGNMKRSSMENIEFSSLSLIGKLNYNLPNFIYYTFIVNYYMLITLIISNIYLVKNNIKNKYIRNTLIIILLLPILTIISYFLNEGKIINYNYFSNHNNILIIIYYLMYSIITFILLLKEGKKEAIFFFVIGILSNVVMIMSPTWGYRTSFGTYLFITISNLIIIDKYIKNNKLITYILELIVILLSITYLLLYISIHKQYKENYEIIKNGIKNKSKLIEIYKYPYFINCNINPENEFHIARFKEYYGIDSDIEIKLIENKWKYIIIY